MSEFRRSFFPSYERVPVTTGALLVLSLSFFVRLLLPGMTGIFIFSRPGNWWGVFSYPLAEMSPLTLVLGGLWFYLAGGQLEIR